MRNILYVTSKPSFPIVVWELGCEAESPASLLQTGERRGRLPEKPGPIFHQGKRAYLDRRRPAASPTLVPDPDAHHKGFPHGLPPYRDRAHRETASYRPFRN